MRPVAIFRFSPTEGPGRFGEFLADRGLPFELIPVDAGAEVPDDVAGFSGIGLMGGPMSVNDPLPWIEPLCELLRRAVDAHVPTIGHCLGGQLLARALGGRVMRAPAPEIGWHSVEARSQVARDWVGRGSFEAFHWHFETFVPPPHATPMLASELCREQAFLVGDRHLGMQCHVEMTRSLVETWVADGARDIERNPGPGVQSPASILSGLDDRLAMLGEIADRVYARWAALLAH